METVFYKNIKEHPERLELYLKGIEDGKISEFSLELLSKLKKTNYGGIPGNIYLYAYPTSFETVGNKMEILTWIYRDEDYKLVHGDTNSSREIMFHRYNLKHLDYNSWLEVKVGSKEYVIDTFSMLMIEKNLYYELENPSISKVITSDVIKNHPLREEGYDNMYSSYDSLLLLMDSLEYFASLSPYKDYLEKEIEKLKDKSNYEDMKKEYESEMKRIYK